MIDVIARSPQGQRIVIVIIDTDGIYKHFRSFQNVFDLSGIDVALRVEAVRHHQQNFLVVLGRTHLFHAHLNGVVSCGFAAGLDLSQAALEDLHIGCKRLPDVDIGVKRNNEHFVLRGESQGDFTNGLQCLLQLVPHAAAAIDQNSYTDRHAQVVRKKRDFLFYTILKHLKIVDFQAIHILSALVEHRGRDIHELNLDVQTIARILSTWRCRLLRGRLLSGRL